jgi:hypothetical protein
MPIELARTHTERGPAASLFLPISQKVSAFYNFYISNKRGNALAMSNQEDIFGPFLALQLVTIGIWFFMYSRRIPFINGYMEKIKKDGGSDNELADMVDPKSKHYLPMIAPMSVTFPSDNLKNLFEVPVLFYATLGYLYMTRSVDTVYIWASWAYVALRVLHSIIHCTSNHPVILRFSVYAASSMAMWFMVGRASFNHFMVGYPQLQ